jgi:hypothetical protein
MQRACSRTTHLGKRHSEVERSLAAHGGQQRIRLLLLAAAVSKSVSSGPAAQKAAQPRPSC